MKEKINEKFEKIGASVFGQELEIEVEKKELEKKDDGKNLNQRIEDLVNEMEKTNHLVVKVFSLKSAFIRGLLQGLGIIIGSTILAGALYSVSLKIFGNNFLQGVTLEDVIKESKVLRK